MKKGKFIVNVFIVLLVVSFILFQLSLESSAKFSTGIYQEINKAPLVKILSPSNNRTYEWNTPLHYSLSVSDKEDGESKFDEIEPNEVFLEVEYAEAIVDGSNYKIKKDPQGLAIIKTSNCFNCHAFNSKLIGPSFFEISKRYQPIKANVEMVARRIRDGSSGVWGKVGMPSHPELGVEETQNIVHWILENAGNQEVNYYNGIEGVIQMIPPNEKSRNGFLILTASYTDHGLKGHPNQNLKGQERIVLQGK